MVIPIDQHQAAEAEKRAKADAEIARKSAIRKRIESNTRDLKRHERKLREITECNATMLSNNGDLLIRNEMLRIQRETEGLTKDLEKKPE